jgi:hypothetical protein
MPLITEKAAMGLDGVVSTDFRHAVNPVPITTRAAIAHKRFVFVAITLSLKLYLIDILFVDNYWL